MQVDLSPISLRALWTARSSVGLCAVAEKYNVTSTSVLLRLAGAGYRVRARLHSTSSRRWCRLKAVAGKPFRSSHFPLEFWIGRGNPLNPYLRAKLITFLLRELKPKEFKLFPQEMVFDGEREILERTVLFGWMKQWLRWVSWYYTEALSPDVTIDQLLNAPYCSTSWKRSNLDINLFLALSGSCMICLPVGRSVQFLRTYLIQRPLSNMIDGYLVVTKVPTFLWLH